MRLIITVFIICLFGKLINCNNNDQSRSTPVQSGPDAKGPPAGSEPLKLESRQAMAKSHHHQYADRSDGSVQHVAINTHNLSPKETAYHNANPNAPIGYIKIDPVFAPFSSHHTPEQQGSTSFISFVKPQQAGVRSSFGFSLTNKLKNFMSSLFWKDTSSSMPYMTSGSSYSFAFKQPPPQFYAPVAAASQYKPVVFSAPGPASGNGYPNKYAGSFGSGYQSMQAAPGSYYPSSGQVMNSNLNTAYLRNSGMPNGPLASGPMFPSDSNTVNSYASAGVGNQYRPNSNAAQQTGDGNFNQRSSAAASAENAPRSTVARTIASDSSSSLSTAGSSPPLTGNNQAAVNPVSLLQNGKQPFGSY